MVYFEPEPHQPHHEELLPRHAKRFNTSASKVEGDPPFKSKVAYARENREHQPAFRLQYLF